MNEKDILIESQKKRIAKLEREIRDTRMEYAAAIVRFGADCDSCENQGNAMICNGCSSSKQSKYKLIGFEV